jgi:FkbM family methyltransferase
MYQNFQWTQAAEKRNRLTRYYEPVQPYLLVDLAQTLACNVFIDVGANIGLYSLFFSSLSAIQKIHAFEPSPKTFEELCRNIELNKQSQKITAHNKAVSDSSKLLTFGIISNLSGANSVVDTSIHVPEKFQQKISIAGVPLDSYLEERGQRLCIKIDIEGHEKDALRGMRDFLCRNEVVMQIENYGRDGAELASILNELGFTKLFNVGPDFYYTNIKPILTDRSIVEVFERATSCLVQTNLMELNARPINSPINISVGGLFNVQLLGATAILARRARAMLRNRH